MGRRSQRPRRVVGHAEPAVTSVASPVEADSGSDDPERRPQGRGGSYWASPEGRRSWNLLEGVVLLASPAIAFFVLRLRAMAPTLLPDPSMSSTYIFDPRDFFYRYNAVLTPTARMREGSRVGFLVPARLSYLAFGAVPGFFVFRYVLALVAVVPAYLLLRRLYGLGAGTLAVVVIMSSPILVTAWGTDFPDSAVVSYLIGAIACLLMPTAGRRARVAWLGAAAFLFTMAVWSLATCAVLVAVVLIAYLFVRLLRQRRHLCADVVVLAVVAVVVTVAVGGASAAELGQFNYITPTIKSVRFLDTPAQEAMWHSANWRWAPYRAYVLVPPALAAVWIVVVGRRWRALGPVQLVIGLTAVGEVAVAYALQFIGKVQFVEEYFFYSTLWSSLCLSLIVFLAELTRPLAAHRVWRYAPAALVVGVTLVYETDPHVPAFEWVPLGFILAVGVVLIAALADRFVRVRRGVLASLSSGVVVVGIIGLALVLTVSPTVSHKMLPNTAVDDPPTAYNTALGGKATQLIANYRFISKIHAFTGNATYPGEQLLTCLTVVNEETTDAMGQFHAWFDLLAGQCQNMTSADVQAIEARHAAQVLAISAQPMNLQRVLTSLAVLHPFLARKTVVRSGPYDMRLWLIEIPRYLTPPATTATSTQRDLNPGSPRVRHGGAGSWRPRTNGRIDRPSRPISRTGAGTAPRWPNATGRDPTSADRESGIPDRERLGVRRPPRTPAGGRRPGFCDAS